MRFRPSRGFTLIELMITVAVIAILAAVAMPSYTAYIQRSRVPTALDGLSSLATRMEQCYQDTSTYTDCSPCTTPPTADNFTITCSVVSTGSDAGKKYTATATGSGPVSGYVYTIDQDGNRATTSHPNGSNSSCWTMRGSSCDS